VVESELLADEALRLTDAAHDAATTGPDGRLRERVTAVELDGRRFDVSVLVPEPPWAELAERRRQRTAARGGGGGAHDAIVSPMQGTVLSVQVADGDPVTAGQVICVVEAMKMENEVYALGDGIVAQLSVQPGEAVGTSQVICLIVPVQEPNDGA
jgi:acetyl-CoA/propionyl-CoA carboxylase biotin carboxyl carrier protein